MGNCPRSRTCSNAQSALRSGCRAHGFSYYSVSPWANCFSVLLPFCQFFSSLFQGFPSLSLVGCYFSPLLCGCWGVSVSVGALWGQRCQGQKLQLGLGLCDGSLLYIDWPGKVTWWRVVNLLVIPGVDLMTRDLLRPSLIWLVNVSWAAAFAV